MNGDTVTVYKDDAGEWRWHRQAANGEITSTSGEGYTRRWKAEAAAVQLNPPTVDRPVTVRVEKPEDDQ